MEALAGDQKKKFCQQLEERESVADLPDWCYKKYDVTKSGDEENPVFAIKSKNNEFIYRK